MSLNIFMRVDLVPGPNTYLMSPQVKEHSEVSLLQRFCKPLYINDHIQSKPHDFNYDHTQQQRYTVAMTTRHDDNIERGMLILLSLQLIM